MSASRRLNWVRTGTEHEETVMLIHAVGYDLTYWDRQIEALHDRYNVVAFDLPGHGNSPGEPADYSFPWAAGIVADLIETVSDKPVHLVGISFGGKIAQTMVLERPELVRTLTLMATASTFPEAVREVMRARGQLVRTAGMAAVLQSSLERWFTPETRARRPDIIDRVSKTLLAGNPAIHAAIWDIIARFEVYDRLTEIECPTLVLVGEHDPSTPPSAASALAERIPDARLAIVPNASHLVTLEAPIPVNTAIQEFLAGNV